MEERKFNFQFLLYSFFFAMILNSLNPELEIFYFLKDIGKKGLQISLFLIGLIFP